MDPLPFLGEVERPVRWEVAVTVQRGALDHAGGDRPASGERGRIVQVGLLVEQVGGGGLALGGVQVVAGGFAADRGGHHAGAAGQDRPGVVVDPGLGVESPSAKQHQAARQRYSSTCTKSTTMVTCTPRAWASAWTRASWWLLPSTSATQVRCWPGSRRSASSKTWLMTWAASA